MIATQPFGRTGHDSTRVLFGAAALGDVTQEEADQTLELIVAHGINHLDTAASYGESELRLGAFVEAHRADYFLATKTGERTAEAAWAEINLSLERLRTDHVDLLQLHNLVDEDEWQTAYAKGGALEAAVRAKDEGLVRNIGVTGHGVTVARQHLRSLEQYDFASVLLPYNFPMTRNAAYLADFEELVEVCAARDVAVQTIKSITRAPWQDDADRFASTWYEPLQEQDAIDTAVGWVLGRPGIFLNTVGDIHLLPKVLDAAERAGQDSSSRPSDEAMNDLEQSWGDGAALRLIAESSWLPPYPGETGSVQTTMLEGLVDRVPEGWTEVTFGGRPYGLTRVTRADGGSVSLYAEELGGPDVVSTNVYRTASGVLLRPCEMPAAKVVEFLRGWVSRAR